MTIKTTPPRCGQKGFTLIEIVMVLVLLGILAAVAVPKYFDLEEEANKAVAKTVEQEMQARLEGEFAQSMLNGQTCGDCHEFCVHGIIGAHHTGTPHEHDYQETNLS